MSCWRLTGICRRAPLWLPHDAPALGDVGRVVGEADLVVKQLAANVADEFLQLEPPLQQLTRAVECLDTLGEGSQHRDQPLGSLRPVDFFFLVTHTSAFPTVRRLPDSPIPPSDYTTSRCRPRALSPLARLYYIAAPLTRAPRLQHERGVPLHGQKPFGAAQPIDPHLL